MRGETQRVGLGGWAAIAVAAWLASATAEVAADAAVRVGTLAPTFAVEDSNGLRQTLEALKGRTVVLEWTNPECPFVNKHYTSRNMQSLQSEATGRGVIWLTISSSAPGNVGYVDALEANALLDERKSVPSGFLLDRDGRMAEAYGVTVALTMAVIDPQGVLAYYGAIDDKPTAKVEDVPAARNYVRDALVAVAEGRTPKPAQTRPYGCAAR
jgi:peroxiredoxin